MRTHVLGVSMVHLARPCALVPPSVTSSLCAVDARLPRLEVCLHDGVEGVASCLGLPERLVVWPGAQGIVFSSWLTTEELRGVARQLLRELSRGRILAAPSLRAWLGRHPWLPQILEDLLHAELAAACAEEARPRLSLLVPTPLHVRRHHLDPLATAWREREAVSARAVRFEPRTESEEGSARAASPLRRLRDVPQDLVGGPFGLLLHRPRRFLSVSSLAFAHTPVILGEQVEDALGRGLDFAQAELSAAFEALERRCVLFDHQRPVVRGSFARLGQERQVLDPRLLLLPEAQPEVSGLVPYGESLEFDWVACHSLRHGDSVLVPARAVFLGYREDPLFLPSSSSGCALGGSLEEALLHALLELIERDAFLLTWYARRPVARLELDAVTDRRIHLLCDQAGRMGYEIRAYRTTWDAPVPSVWVLAVATVSGRPKTLSSAGAHVRPEQAVLSALVEVVGSLAMMAPGFDLAQGRACVADPGRVRTAMDHFHLFGVPEHFQALAFLEQGGRLSLEEAFAAQAVLRRGRSLTGKLECLVGALLGQHPDVIFVDLTSPRLARQGLHCVRALVPGLLPMTFGHHNRRVQGSERLCRLREAVHPGSSGEACLPHPFP